jgi:NAD+ diphosphatase
MSEPHPVNIFAGGHVERAVHRRRDGDWLAATLRSAHAALIPICEELTLIEAHPAQPRPRLLDPHELSSLQLSVSDVVFLGEHEDRPCFAVDCPPHLAEHLRSFGRLESLRRHAAQVQAHHASLLAYARAMVLWHRQHGFCPRCGAPTDLADGGHMRLCSNEACRGRQFPRLDPAVIVMVSKGERCLLGRQANWPPGRYSTVAGFVEPGEGLEDAVRREVHEETNIRVEKVRYFSSQPWPFPQSLMLGFFAEALNHDIHLNDQELEDARWFTREEIVDQIHSAGGSLPMELSIAYRLISAWFDGDRPGLLAQRLRETREAS